MFSVAALHPHVEAPSKTHTCLQFPTKVICLFLFGWAYLLFGGAVFSHFELPHERRAERQYIEAIENATIRGNFTDLQVEVLHELLAQLRVLGSETATIGQIDWSFIGATFFALTAVTTIGYGKLAPKTLSGQIFCLMYSIVGIPLVFYMFAYLGSRLMDIIGFRISSLREGSEFKRKQLQNEAVVLPMFVALFIAGLLICTFALYYHYTEPWTYFEAFYFCFFTMTTTGFGDYAPTSSNDVLALVLQGFGLFLSLSVYSYLLNVAILLFTRLVHYFAQHGLSRMDIEGKGHIGPAEVFYYCLGRTKEQRLQYQANLLHRLFQQDMDQTVRVEILDNWGNAIALGHRNLRLPRGLKVYVMLGGPFAGKSTMCKLLAEKYNLELIDVERLLLLEILAETGHGRAIEALVQHGCVLPKQLVLDLIITRVSKLPRDSACIIDGFPVDANQAQYFEQEFKYAERVFLLKCSDERLAQHHRMQDKTVSHGLRTLLGSRLQPVSDTAAQLAKAQMGETLGSPLVDSFQEETSLSSSTCSSSARDEQEEQQGEFEHGYTVKEPDHQRRRTVSFPSADTEGQLLNRALWRQKAHNMSIDENTGAEPHMQRSDVLDEPDSPFVKSNSAENEPNRASSSSPVLSSRMAKRRSANELRRAATEVGYAPPDSSVFFKDWLREVKNTSPTTPKKKWRRNYMSPLRRQRLLSTQNIVHHPDGIFEELNDHLIERWKENRGGLREYFRSRLHEIDAETSIEETFASLCAAFESGADSALLDDLMTMPGTFAIPGISYPPATSPSTPQNLSREGSLRSRRTSRADKNSAFDAWIVHNELQRQPLSEELHAL
eukprot:m.186153 g.186153  ORF g.186153 m.186153 type:complete len:835 (-) comp16695_c0_seq1:60-2564(-)